MDNNIENNRIPFDLAKLFSKSPIVYYVSYYGDPNGGFDILTGLITNAFVSLKDKVYVLGGQKIVEKERVHLSGAIEYTFSPNWTFQETSVAGNDVTYKVCRYCQGYALPDNRTIVTIGTEFKIVDEDWRIGLAFYNTDTHSYTYINDSIAGILPPWRDTFSSAISENGDTLFLIGGQDISIQYPEMQLYADGACASMLSDGTIVIAFGIDGNGIAHNASEVFLFDTNLNTIRIQPISGKAPIPRTQVSCTLGFDKKTIYYFGGADVINLQSPYQGVVYGDTPILDTSTWSWVQYTIPGITPNPSKLTSMTLFGSDKIIISLDNVPGVGENIKSSNIQWFTNYEDFDHPYKKPGLSDGGKAGIIVAVLVIVAMIFALLWKFVPATRRIVTYVQQDMIWSPRSGEPLWAETTRLLVRFILLVLFLAFVSYVIYRSIESPIVSQIIDKETDSVLVPDIRFCFDGFDETDSTPSISCVFRNGSNCQDNIKPLDRTVHSPIYSDDFGNVTCLLFIPGPDFRLINDNTGYTDSTGTKIQFSFFATPQNLNDTSIGVIYADFYAPGYDPNVDVFNLSSFAGDSKLNGIDLTPWLVSEQAFNLVDSIILKQGVVSTASYTLTTVEKLRKTDGWNYIGFSSSYDTTMEVESKFKDAPQSNKNMPSEGDSNMYMAKLTIQPRAFLETTKRDQKVFTLLNAFAQAGGVLGLFVAVQTLLFGFRPQSPWGIVHRWSFGSLRIRLTDRLANYFNKTGTPVPLVNPVNNDPNLHHYFKNDNIYMPYGPGVPSANEEQIETTVVQENRVKRVEERLQLMELLLKSYYLNDEVFRSLDQAVKRGNEERRRSSMIQASYQETDSVLGNNVLNEEFSGDTNDRTNVARRPSSTVFEMRQRGQYQPNLTSEAPLELYDEESEIGKR
ncbi:hypothetical protein INT47_002630 [Mucor saturninus]|uniref:Uncharacterized protein n=1 Tax=Mucor saturninus TaxID=64648 RepID=A0A8H7R8F1_9FUNG|nr:hypothetical protein INT47_002630 [Mucor saturninus]